MSVAQLAVVAVSATLTLASVVHAQVVAEPESISLEQARSLITVEQAMADPDWFGRSPENARWADDSKHVYYQQKREGSELRDWFRYDLASGETIKLEPADLPSIQSEGGDYDATATRRVFVRSGDVFLADRTAGTIQQLTRTTARERGAFFMAGSNAVAFQRDGTWLIRDLASGLEIQPIDVRAGEDPNEKRQRDREDPGYVEAQQRRLLATIDERITRSDQRRSHQRELHEADTTRVPPPIYLGRNTTISRSVLSPSGRHLALVVTAPGDRIGQRDEMPDYVTESGYAESRRVRSLVGTSKPRRDRLFIVDIDARTANEVELDGLPTITDDPLEAVRTENAAKKADATKDVEADENGDKPEAADEANNEGEGENEHDESPSKPRPVSFGTVSFSPDGERLVVQAYSEDNKDRWIAAVNLDDATLIPLEHDPDEAWINWRYRDLGWLPDSKTIYFLSERTGYGHLYRRDASDPDAEVTAVTAGEFVVDRIDRSADGWTMLLRANARHPGSYNCWLYDARSGRLVRATNYRGGLDTFDLSPDGSKILVRHSRPNMPPELYVQEATIASPPMRITNTISDEFLAMPWIEPEVVAIPGTHGRPIYTKVYLPPEGVELAEGGPPLVLFIHGAGYLQDAHRGWSTYFREHMFNQALAYRGYIVLTPDYRASAGYGRDWRTTIYRHMGQPELEDLEDCIDWAVFTHGADAERVGIYGGSYGGFLALMALFKQPELYAAGVANRPVTDWAHYNDGYTSNILNTPEVDPIAYERSSPIEFAEGLADPLLICHGVLDDNVFYKDTVRLSQRLIELSKRDWYVMAYPIEPHGFREPRSWLDQYTRTFELFEQRLMDR